MGKVLLGVVLLLLVAILGGGAYLAFVDVPVATTKVEKVLPDDRFPR